MEPSAARRAVLVALQSLAPYCMARWAPAVPDREDSGSWRNDSIAVVSTAAIGPEGTGQLPLLPHQRLWQQVSTSVMGYAVPWQAIVVTEALEEGRSGCITTLQPAPAQVSMHAAEAWRWLGCYSGEAARLHLALFYIYGTYYEWPKRLAGATPQFGDEGAFSMIHM
jgi:Pex2 / Pex12 amino terminal region